MLAPPTIVTCLSRAARCSALLLVGLGCRGGDDSGDTVVAENGTHHVALVGALTGGRGIDRPRPAPGGVGPPPVVDDLDQDGQTPADGDCDDGDPLIYAGAPERCDGRDDDCDGEVDEVGGSVLVYVPSKNEGAQWAAAVQLSGCATGAALAAAPPPEVARCTLGVAASGGPLSYELSCMLVDDGDFVALVEISDAAGGRVYVVAEGSVTNVPPEVIGATDPMKVVLEPDPDDSGLQLSGAAGPISRTFRSLDLGVNDTRGWSLEGAPPGMRIRDDGGLRFSPTAGDLGAWRVVVQAVDDDGGVGELAFTVDVSRGDDADGGLGCCCFGATAALVLPMGALLRRRPTRPPSLRSAHDRSSCQSRL